LLTPIAKAFSTDIGNEVAYLGVQVHGGMGFIEETGAAQHYRDARITTIYEGTNGIQSIDLVTRKLAANGGASVWALLDELSAIVKQVEASNDPAFAPRARNCAMRWARSSAAANGCWSASPPHQTTRWPVRRPICACSARRSAAACSRARRCGEEQWRGWRSAALRRGGAVLRRERHGAGRLAGEDGDRQRRRGERRGCSAAGVASSSLRAKRSNPCHGITDGWIASSLRSSQ